MLYLVVVSPKEKKRNINNDLAILPSYYKYKVEKILNKKKFKGKNRYLVQ